MAQQPSASPRASESNPTPEVAEQVKQTAQEVASQAKRQAEEKINEQKQEAAGALKGVADALHAAGDRLEDDEHGAFAEYAHAAADQVERFTSSIRSRSVGEILDEAQRFAYREPGLFIGGAFLLGIVGSRFLKASQQRSGYSDRYRGMDVRSAGPYSGGRASDFGRPSPGYGGSVTQHGRPLVTNTPGARMPDPASRPSGASPGTTSGGSGGTAMGASGARSAGTGSAGTGSAGTSSGAGSPTGASALGSDPQRRNQ